MNQKNEEAFEEQASKSLKQEKITQKDAKKEAVSRIYPRYEMRTQVEQDPIIKETEIIQNVVEEVDDRYHKYTSIKKEETKEK